MNASERRRELRRLLSGSQCVVVPCAYDCLSARLIEQEGFEVLAISGGGAGASRLGLPDLGLITLAEMRDISRNIAASVSVPVIADMDNGFGSVRNVIRTIRESTDSGVSAVIIEDQIFPKKCGHLDDKSVVSIDEFVKKIEAGCEERPDPELVVIARTDALAVNGVEDAIDRCLRAAKAGADAVFVEAPSSLNDVKAISEALGAMIPLAYNVATGGKSPDLSLSELSQLGFRLMLVPMVCLTPAIDAMRRSLAALNLTGRDQVASEVGAGPRDMLNVVGLSEWERLEARYAAGGRRS